MYPVECEPKRFVEFVQLEKRRYPDLRWEQCEIWLEEDWAFYEPEIAWLLARCYVLEAWNDESIQPQGMQVDQAQETA